MSSNWMEIVSADDTSKNTTHNEEVSRKDDSHTDYGGQRVVQPHVGGNSLLTPRVEDEGTIDDYDMLFDPSIVAALEHVSTPSTAAETIRSQSPSDESYSREEGTLGNDYSVQGSLPSFSVGGVSSFAEYLDDSTAPSFDMDSIYGRTDDRFLQYPHDIQVGMGTRKAGDELYQGDGPPGPVDQDYESGSLQSPRDVDDDDEAEFGIMKPLPEAAKEPHNSPRQRAKLYKYAICASATMFIMAVVAIAGAILPGRENDANRESATSPPTKDRPELPGPSPVAFIPAFPTASPIDSAIAPSLRPTTVSPSSVPSSSPSQFPSVRPTFLPTSTPTAAPTTAAPTVQPTPFPSAAPVDDPLICFVLPFLPACN